MKVLIDIKDNRSQFILELLNSFSFVTTKTLTPYKAEVLEGLKDSVDEMNLIKKGDLKARDAKDLFDEL
jgi:polyhydroxyalkanoate synthesis regulator phasin